MQPLQHLNSRPTTSNSTTGAGVRPSRCRLHSTSHICRASAQAAPATQLGDLSKATKVRKSFEKDEVAKWVR